MARSIDPARRRRQPAYRPEVEPLEDRWLPSSTSFVYDPVVPVIDYGMKARLRAELLYGQQRGNRGDVFAKVGDSITWGEPFLYGLGNPGFDPSNPAFVGSHTDLAPTINFFRADAAVPGANAFSRVSASAYLGWTTLNVLSGPLQSEIDLTHPGFALIMLGTNDLVWDANPQAFEQRLTAVANSCLANGVIPVLSTIPDHLFEGGIYSSRVPGYNQAIADVADSLQVPLWNYWLSMQSLPNKGISADGVHPTTDPAGSWLFTDGGLQFGYNMRNFTAVEVLDKLRRVVLADGTPDYPDRPLTAPTVQFVAGVVETLLHRLPSAADLAYWGKPLEDGVPRGDVVRALWQSVEHRSVQLGQYYATYLHRTPNFNEWLSWMGSFQAGATEAQVQQAILASPEYQATRQSNAAYVTGLYHDVLGYQPDPAAQKSWQQQLQAGMSRDALAQTVLGSAPREAQVVQQLYGNLLGRFASPAEQQAWANGLQQGTLTEAGIAEILLTTDEFLHRVGVAQ